MPCRRRDGRRSAWRVVAKSGFVIIDDDVDDDDTTPRGNMGNPARRRTWKQLENTQTNATTAQTRYLSTAQSSHNIIKTNFEWIDTSLVVCSKHSPLGIPRHRTGLLPVRLLDSSAVVRFDYHNSAEPKARKMISNVSRAVRFVSTVHGTTSALRRGEKSVEAIIRSTVFSPQYFPKFLGVTMVCSFLGGYTYMETLRRSRLPTSAAHVVVWWPTAAGWLSPA